METRQDAWRVVARWATNEDEGVVLSFPDESPPFARRGRKRT